MEQLGVPLEEEGKFRQTRKREELIERFGHNILEIVGFVDFLTRQTDEILDVKTDMETRVGVCLFDKHWRTGVSVGMASVVTAWHNNKFVSKEFLYRDPEREESCNESVDFLSIEIVETTSETIEVQATPRNKKYVPSSIVLKMPS